MIIEYYDHNQEYYDHSQEYYDHSQSIMIIVRVL